MTTLNISLSEEPLQRLQELAREAGIAPEEFLRESVERWLAAKPPLDFEQAAAYVFRKKRGTLSKTGLMRYVTITEIVRLHQIALEQSGGADGIRDPGAIESAIAQPAMSFGGMELYPTLAEKAAVLCFFGRDESRLC